MFLKKIIIICFILLISGCSIKTKEISDRSNFSIEIVTSNDKYNILFKEGLKRFFLPNLIHIKNTN